MLRALRAGGAGQIMVAGIVFAIITVFVLEFRGAAGTPTGSLQRECFATVRGTCLTDRDFAAAYGLIVPRGTTAKVARALSLRQRVVEGMVERELLVEEAERLGLGVDEDAAKHELRRGHAHVSLPAAHALRLGTTFGLVAGDDDGIARDLIRELPVVNPKTQEVDDELYARVVRTTTGRSPKEFLKMQRRELLAARMRDLVRARVRVTDEEAFGAYARDKTRVVLRYVRADAEWFARYAVDASDAAIDAWGREHASEVDAAWKPAAAEWKAGCALGHEIAVEFQPNPTEAQKAILRDKIDQAKGLIDGGEAFEAVAKELSDGPTAFLGGELGCVTEVTYGLGGDALTAALGKLAPGAVSDVVESKRGFHLIRLDGKVGATEAERLGRLTAARRIAVRSKAGALGREFSERLVKAAREGAELDAALPPLVAGYAARSLLTPPAKGAKKATPSDEAQEEPLPLRDLRAPRVEVTAPFTIDADPIPGTLPGASTAEIAFSLANVGDVAPEPVALIGGHAVLQLKEKETALREQFEPEKENVRRRLAVIKRSDALIEYVARLRGAHKDEIETNAKLLEDKATGEDG